MTRTELYTNINALSDAQLEIVNAFVIALANGTPVKSLATAPAPAHVSANVKTVKVYTAGLSQYTRKFSGIHKSATKDFNGTWDKANSVWYFTRKSDRDKFVKAQAEYNNTLVKGEAELEQ